MKIYNNKNSSSSKKIELIYLSKTTTTKTATKLRTCSFISKFDDRRNRKLEKKEEIKAVAVVKYTCIYVFL